MIRIFCLLIIVGAAAMAAASCGSDVTNQPVGGSGGTGGEEPVECNVSWSGEGRQPVAPPADTATSGREVVLAISALQFPDGSPTTWRELGFDVDGVVSSNGDSGLCQPDADAPADIHEDGDDGIDNAFGRIVLPLFTGFATDLSTDATQGIEVGGPTLLFAFDDIGTGDDQSPLTTRVYRAAALGQPADFDGDDAWPVRSDSLDDTGDITSAKNTLQCSYLNGGTWVSGERFDIDLPVMINFDTELVLPIRDAIVTMEMNGDNDGASSGIIAGIIGRDDMLEELERIAGDLDESLCMTAQLEPLLDQVRSAADTLTAGGQDGGQSCDAISVGIGFSASEVTFGGVVLAPATPPLSCE